MIRPVACEKAREAVSLRLDAELSDLGAARLDAHLAQCAECAAFAADASVAADALRTALLESPTYTFALPARRARPFALLPAAAAAMLVVAVVGLSGVAGLVGDRSRVPRLSTSDIVRVGKEAGRSADVRFIPGGQSDQLAVEDAAGGDRSLAI